LLAGKLVPVVSTVHLVVRELIGVTSLALQRAPQEPIQIRVLNDTSNPLEYLLRSFTGSGHEQSPTRAKAPPLL
jgi:hypothetical protein